MKVLIGAALRGQPARYQRELDAALKATKLRDIAFAYDFHDEPDIWGGAIADSDVLLIPTSRGFSGAALARAPQLRFVQKLGAPDHIDIAACRKNGVAVSVLPNPGHIAVAEHTLMFILGMARQTLSGHNAVVRGENPLSLDAIRTTQHRRLSNWLDLPRDAFGLIADKTLGFIGFGDIAREVAVRARCFGMKIIYSKPHRLTSAVEREFGIEYADLPGLLRGADFVSLHATRSVAEEPIIGAPELALMKPAAVLINTARGNQIDQHALVECLRQGRIGGACLDVYATEPANPEDFAGLPNVMLTPHTAGVMPWNRRFRDALFNIEAYFSRGNVQGLL